MPKSSRILVYALTVAAVLLATAFFGYTAAYRYYLRVSAVESDASLRLASAGLSGALQRFEPIPALLADRADIRWSVTLNATEGDIELINDDLKEVAQEIGASDIYVMNAQGLTIAASNFDKDTTFIGNSYMFRPYFSEAIKGQPSRYFALGTSSLKRGYYFSAPIYGVEGPTGVLAVKFEIDDFEQDWEGFSYDLIATDPDNIIFMSSRLDWLFGSLNPLEPKIIDRLNASRKYPVSQLQTLDATFKASDDTGVLQFSQAMGGARYLVRSQAMPDAGLTLRLLTENTVVAGRASQATAIAVLMLLVLLMIVGFILLWRDRQLRRIKEQQEAKELLEHRVAERTADLKREVHERIQAEEELRHMQKELLQAGKLAALGQMSAALSHELNQPLAAVKSYADNAAIFIDRDRSSDARANLTRISEMADRMAQISKSLRNFARKPREQIGAVNLANVMNDAKQVMSGRLHESGATLKLGVLPDDLNVVGGHVRLQQVIVNLINNALDAMSDQVKPSVEITFVDHGDKLDLRVRDHGAGISDEVIEKIFDPFFTTKGINQGLGLGLSISFNILRDFGGQLDAFNHREGGAVFVATLVKSGHAQKAAE